MKIGSNLTSKETHLSGERMESVNCPLMLLPLPKPIKHAVKPEEGILLSSLNDVVDAKNSSYIVRVGVQLSIDGLTHGSFTDDV